MAQFKEDISLSYADLPVLACCVVSGLCDSVAFNAGGVFVSMQTGESRPPVLTHCCLSFSLTRPLLTWRLTLTNAVFCHTGNTIFLALGASRLPSSQPILWLKALVSIVAFWLGCLAFSKSRHFHPQRKATLSLSFLFQSVFIFVAASLAQTAAVPAFSWSLLGSPGHNEEAREAEENNNIILLPLALLAFQFGGQIVTSRILGFNEVPTNVLTSVYCDLFSDPKLLAPLSKNPKRNRRLASVILMVIGGIAGGWLQKSRAGMASALWIAGSIKLVLAVAWMGWQGRRIEVDEKTRS